jgi:hypothetical protein
VVEHDLAKVGVEGSSPFARSRFPYGEPRFDEGPLSSGLFVWHDFDAIAQQASTHAAGPNEAKWAKTHAAGSSGPCVLFDAAMQRKPAATKSSRTKPRRRNFFSILIGPIRAGRPVLFTSHDCANIFASDHHPDENSSLKTFKINDRRSRPAA